MTTKTKAAGLGTHAASRLHCTLNSISASVWVLSYSLEEARQSHEAHRRRFRMFFSVTASILVTDVVTASLVTRSSARHLILAERLACCIGLAALRLLTGGLHHA